MAILIDDLENINPLEIYLGEISLPFLKGDKGDKGEKGDSFRYEDFTQEQLEKLKGSKGDTGPQGPEGPQGEQGIQGPQGEQGNVGPANALSIGTVEAGEEAKASISGDYPNQKLNLILPRGDKGEKGETGLKGDTGPSNNLSIGTVEVGDVAEATISGESPNQKLNLVLPRGEKGQKGDTGEKGEIGETGPANMLKIGTVSSGEEVEVTITGETPNQTLNFILPKGDKGDIGPRGPQGIQGEQGVQGEQGPQGIKGDKGDKGDSGEDFSIFKTYESIADMELDKNNVPEGKFVMIASNIDDPDNAKLYVKGVTDFKFMADLSGAQGVKGEKGDTGETGNQGPQGEQGPQGIQGPQGLQGVPGEKGDTGASAGFGTINASIDNNTGTPSVSVTAEGPNTAKNFNFIFKNLKGEKGEQGIQGPQGEPGKNPTIVVTKIKVTEEIEQNTNYEVPDYIVGTNSLSVYFEGCKLIKDENYIEIDETHIQFKDWNVPVESNLEFGISI